MSLISPKAQDKTAAVTADRSITRPAEYNVTTMKARKWLARVAIALLSFLVIAYVGVCAWLKANEHRLVFTKDFPTEPVWQSLGLQPQTVQIGTLGSVPLFAWSMQSLPSDSQANQWVLHFHGSGDNVTCAFNQAEFHRLRSMGFSILATEYPGYGGKPTMRRNATSSFMDHRWELE